VYIYITWKCTCASLTPYGVALVGKIDKIIGLCCKRDLWKRHYSAKETCNFIDPTDRSHPILHCSAQMVYIYMYVCIYTNMNIYYIHIHVCMNIYINICIYHMNIYMRVLRLTTLLSPKGVYIHVCISVSRAKMLTWKKKFRTRPDRWARRCTPAVFYPNWRTSRVHHKKGRPRDATSDESRLGKPSFCTFGVRTRLLVRCYNR